MKNVFSKEQKEVYSAAFKKGDLVLKNGELTEVCSEFDSGNVVNKTCSNEIINQGDMSKPKGNSEIFSEKSVFKILTLNDYKVEESDKLVWLGESSRDVVFGGVYNVYSDSYHTFKIVADNRKRDWLYPENVNKEEKALWGVIPSKKNLLEV